MTTATIHFVTKFTPAEIAEQAVRLNNDVNGNPRYYISAMMFRHGDIGTEFRPQYCRKYTGKRYGAGWVFSSYSLEGDIRDALEVTA